MPKFEYNSEIWYVTEVHEYDWENEIFGKVHRVESENETNFLYIEKDLDLFVTFSKLVMLQ